MPSAPVKQTLDRLRALCDPPRAALVDDLSARLGFGAVRLLLIGEAKRGKSTLGNALLRREILPTGVTPVTALTTAVSAGRPERVEIRYLDGRRERRRLDELGDFVTEHQNPSNTRNVATVEVFLEEGLPAQGMSIVDTPGVGSVFAHNTDEAAAARDRMDLALFVLTADPPLSASEKALLTEVRQRAVATFVVLNKADRLTPTELIETADFLTEMIPDIQVLPCSARGGLQAALAGDDTAYAASGVGEIRDIVANRVATRGRADLESSVGAAAHRLADALRDETDLTLAAWDARQAAGHDRVAAFQASVRRLPGAAAEAADRVGWRVRSVHRELTEDAASAVGFLTGQARRTVEDALVLPDHTGRATARGEVADQALQDLVRRGVTDWSQRAGDWLAARLDEIAGDEQRHLEDAARGVRESAERELGVRLRLSPVTIEVDARPRFWLDLADPVGWEAPLAGTLRRHAPAALTRSRAAAALRRRAVDLPDKNIGRARYDLDQRLADAARTLSAAVTAAYDDLGRGLTTALVAAATVSMLTSAQAAEQRRELIERRHNLDELVDDLAAATIPA